MLVLRNSCTDMYLFISWLVQTNENNNLCFFLNRITAQTKRVGMRKATKPNISSEMTVFIAAERSAVATRQDCPAKHYCSAPVCRSLANRYLHGENSNSLGHARQAADLKALHVILIHEVSSYAISYF